MQIYTGAEFRAFRLKRNLTQKQLADKLGLTTQYISLIEIGRRRVSPRLLQTMAEKLEMPFTLTFRNPQL